MKIMDYLNLGYIYLSTYPTLRRVWQDSGKSGEIRVSYGYDRIPGPDEHVFGGLVTLEALNKLFPSCKNRPNILYLVSSALPYFPVRLAKMAKKAGAQIVINQNGVAYPGWFGKGWQRENRHMVSLHSHADYVFYQSQFCQLSARQFLGERSGPCEVLYNPVDTRVFCPLNGEASKSSAINLLLAGSHWSFYRPKVALEVLQLVSRTEKNVRLQIAGRLCWEKAPSIAERQMRDTAKTLGVDDRVKYIGPYNQIQAVSLLQQSSILLHTKYNDPCPRLVVEAMACGVPVVYSATGGTPELVGEEAGIGVDGPLDWEQDHPPDPEALALAVLQVIDSLESYRKGARNRAVSKFDAKPWLQRHAEIFKAIVRSN